MTADPLFWLAAAIAVTSLGLSKGGFSGVGTIAVPVLALIISPLQAVGILLPILLVQDVVTIWSYRRQWDGWNLAVMIPGQILGAGIGWLLAAHVSDALVRLVVGVVAVVFTLNYWLGRRPPETGLRPPAAKGVFWGSINGLTGFLAHAGAPPLQIFLLPQRLPKEVFVGTLTMLFCANNIWKIGPYYALGQLSAENMATAAILLPLAVASNLAGIWLVRRTPVSRFYAIVYVLIFIVGLELIRTGATAILSG